MIMSAIDKLKDPIVHYHSEDYIFLPTIIIQMPLDKVTIEYYDWMTGDKCDYEYNVTNYGEKAKTRFRCMFTSLGDVDLDLLSLYVNSVNIWFNENIIQIELKHMVDTDYSMFFPYMKLVKMWRKADRVLSYKQ